MLRERSGDGSDEVNGGVVPAPWREREHGEGEKPWGWRSVAVGLDVLVLFCQGKQQRGPGRRACRASTAMVRREHLPRRYSGEEPEIYNEAPATLESITDRSFSVLDTLFWNLLGHLNSSKNCAKICGASWYLGSTPIIISEHLEIICLGKELRSCSKHF